MKNFYIGQEIVAIDDHSQGKFKTGNTFFIKSLRIGTCGCDTIDIDIGVLKTRDTQKCLQCGKVFINNTQSWWFDSKHFVPLDSLMNEEIAELKHELQL
jgi:hypothetical protein